MNYKSAVKSVRRIELSEDPLFLVVDLFCGAGGTTTGFEEAYYVGADGQLHKTVRVIACVNHDHKAIESHWRNHRRVRHFNEDIRTLDLTKLMRVVNWWRRKYPNAKLILWASLECTNFSKAKGGQSRDADSRTLADHLHRYVAALQPDFIQIENVVEFMSWGPLRIAAKSVYRNTYTMDGVTVGPHTELKVFLNKKTGITEFAWIPESTKNGKDWLRWRKEICAHGYVDEWRELNSADFGAYTSRNRLFGMFARDRATIHWPEPTHAKNPGNGKLFDPREKWKAVKDVLDFSDEGESIFARKKPLSDKTLERIFAGLLKYVAKGDTAFISKYFSGKPASKNISIDGPAGTIRCIDGQALIQSEFLIDTQWSTRNGSSARDLDKPCNTLLASASPPKLIQPQFLIHYYGTGGQHSSVEEPGRTISTRDRSAIVDTHFLEKSYGGYRNNQSVDQPAGSVMPNDKHRLIEVEPFVLNKNSSTAPCVSTSKPAPTITQRAHYLINPSWGGNPGSVDEPSPVIIARQDKAPLYLVQAEHGPVQIAVYAEDSEIAVKIKQFMAYYGLVDIKMRMLRVKELLKIQGFPDGYHLEGNQTDQKKFIGNSVVPLVVKCWIEAIETNLRQAA